VPGFAVLAVAGGFRPSAPVLMTPLLALALWRSGMRKPGHAIAGIAAGAACCLAWLTPTALMTGGFGALAALNRAQAVSSFQKTSVFYGAPASAHLHMAVDVSVYLAVGAAGFLPLLVASVWRRRNSADRPAAAWARPVFFLAWMAPNLGLVYLLHCSQPGYVLASVPPMLLILGWLCRNALSGAKWTAAGVAAALVVSWFPYERFVNPAVTTLPYVLLRAAPRISRLIESSQREVRAAIDSLPGRPEQKSLVCLRNRFEAPNIRTVTYDFSDVPWSEQSGALAPAGWLCDGAGLPAALRLKYPGARRIAGNQLYSFWAAR
jgi:hypothetical protein